VPSDATHTSSRAGRKHLPLPFLGALALAAYALQGGYDVWHGRPADLLWACHLGALAIGVGCVTRRAALVAVGLSFLAYGVPLWLLDLATGGEFVPTSAGTHLGGLAVGVAAVRRLGWPTGTWRRALAASIGLLGVTRLVTPPAANVNLVFAVAGGWEARFPSHAAYLALMIAGAGAVFFIAERLARRRAVAPRAV
jgi:hypothetical protein